MSTKEVGLSSSESMTLKALSGVGLAIFALFMFANWQRLLSEAKLAEETQPQAVATQPSSSSTPSSATPVSTTSSTEPTAGTTSANTVTSVSSTQPATTSASSTEPAPLVTSTNSSTTDVTTNQPSMAATIAAPEPTQESISEITDTTVIQNLNQQLYDKVDKAWQAMPTFSQDLVYQVVVQEDGDIVEYDPLNPAAANFLKDVPIDELSKEQAATPLEAVAKFLVVMTPNGKLEVSPWMGKN